MQRSGRVTLQQQQIRRQLGQSDAFTFFNLLTGPALFDPLEAQLPAHRERRFPPTETLAMFLRQALSEDRSCQHAVNDTAMARVAGHLPRCSTHPGAYCRARQRQPTLLIASLIRHSGRHLTYRMPPAWRWRGRAVRLVDGTTVSMPDTAVNQAQYPQPRSQQPGLGFPQCRLAALICLGSGAILDAARFDPVLVDKASESRQAITHLCNLGHQTTAFIGRHEESPPGRARYEGFRAAILANHRKFEGSMIQVSDFRDEGRYRSTTASLRPKQRPTAICLANNLMTVSALHAIKDHAISIPEEMPVIGFDDLSLAELLNPPLAVIRRPGIEQEEVSAKPLFEQIRNEAVEAESRRIELQVEIVVRDSTGVPPQHVDQRARHAI
ncbi:MAG: LacI family transcriptional regulator [Rhodanobacter sp.]|nr:MAG: LacI family transcriptional regulator [Rhodanobacter sp.]TAM42890.1 MAG: LacI family transcriptional regulator [Rhodanobacter sp.]